MASSTPSPHTLPASPKRAPRPPHRRALPHRYSGSATFDSEVYEWSGTRLPADERAPPGNPGELGLSSAGSPIGRWQATCLATRAAARSRLKRHGEALQDAAAAAVVCPSLPEAWEAMADAALAAGDKRTAALALSEVLYLQPPSTPRLPIAVSNRRREQAFELAKIRGTYQRGAVASTFGGAGAASGAGAGAEAPVGTKSAVAKEMAEMRKIFSEEYSVPSIEG